MNPFAAILAVAALGPVASSSPPPTLPFDTIGETRASVQPVTFLTLGATQIKFESSTFADVAKFSAAPIGQRGDASEFEMWICFTLSDVKQRLWLTSSELGGRKFIDGAVAARLPNRAHATTDCPELPKAFRPAHLDNGVWLGTSVDSLTQLFGPPSVGPGGWLSFAYLGKDGEYDVGSSLLVRVSNKRVVALLASHTTTN